MNIFFVLSWPNKFSFTKQCLAGGNTIVISKGETNKNITVKVLKRHMAYVNFTHLFSSLCSTVAPKIYNFLKTKHTTYICSGRKDKVCKNLAHTSSKTSQMVATARITIRFLLLFQTPKIERNETFARKDMRFKHSDTWACTPSAFRQMNHEHVLLKSPMIKYFIMEHFESRVNSSGSQKAAVSNVALRMNISAPVRSSDSAKISKNVASLVD